MLRVLFVSRNNKTTSFIKWATEKLFTIQMGIIEQKNKLVSHINGVSYETIQELFSINARTLPCVYLTAFNTVKELRTIMNIDNKFQDDSVVYKFGLTKSFESRKNDRFFIKVNLWFILIKNHKFFIKVINLNIKN